MKKIHYMAGLPRSGSTLLMNILAQRPDVYATPTSGLSEIIAPIKEGWYNVLCHKASDELAAAQMPVIKAVIEAYHKTEKPVVIDKSRGWCSLIETLTAALGEPPKIIAPVRDITQVVASFEKLHRQNMANRQTGTSLLEERVKEWLAASGMVGQAYNALKDAFSRGHQNTILLVEYNDLCHNPESTLKAVEKFLEVEPFIYDFTNVGQRTHEDDSVYGFSDLHTIRREVKPSKDNSQDILGKELHKQLTGSEFWR